jgi:hypothetical protein
MKRFFKLLLWVVLYFINCKPARREIVRRFQPVDRRQPTIQAHWVAPERRGVVEAPVLTRSLMLTIIGAVAFVVSFALVYASFGWAEGLLTIPAFVGYVFFVLFAKTLSVKLKQIRQNN